MTRLGLIGCGGMASVHAARFAAAGERLQVTAVVDVIEDKARQVADELGRGVRVSTDYREILDHVDAVLVATPHHLHHEIGLTCLDAGKHVLMEKPLANTEAQCVDLIDAAERADRMLMVAYPMRFHPLAVELGRLIHDKEYGETFHLSLWTEQLSEYGPDEWFSKAATLGGGQLFSHGCHYIDLLLWYLGDPVSGFHMGTNLGTPWMEREGTSDVSIKFESGAVGYHGGTWGARGTKLNYAFHALTTEGCLEADFPAGKLQFHQGSQTTTLVEAEPWSKFVQNEMAHFLDCVETGATPITDARSSLQSLRVIWRLYEAEDTGAIADLRGLGLAHARVGRT
ncbi:MAG: hypothetical protein QOK43_254 [Acidimicrobiaceae bacterium]|nr:hypothetical protein [Acidimicrobiaceae bacterium]